MGQSVSTTDVVAPSTPPDVEVSRRRQNYLRHLGIQKEKNTPTPTKQKADDYVQEDDSADPIERATHSNNESEIMWPDIKKQNDFRMNFLRKLSYEKVWVPNAQQSPKHQTVIIFDWDDTLLCTSFLYLLQDQDLPDVVQRHVQEIETAVKRLLELALRLGHTFIITNSMTGWVEYSCAKWVPDLLPLVKKIRVISAREKYEPQFPGEYDKWKIQAFLEVQKQLDSEIITNLISLGDSDYEMEAVQEMGKCFTQALIKTIRFLENPSPQELLGQLQLVNQRFERIVEKAHNWVGGAPKRKL